MYVCVHKLAHNYSISKQQIKLLITVFSRVDLCGVRLLLSMLLLLLLPFFCDVIYRLLLATATCLFKYLLAKSHDVD